MKHVFRILIFSLILSFISCNPTPPTPVEVAQKFADAVAEGNVYEAKKYCTFATATKLDLYYTINGVRKNPNFRIHVIREENNLEDVYVYYRHYSDGNSAEGTGEKKLRLVLEDEDWKVDLCNK